MSGPIYALRRKGRRSPSSSTTTRVILARCDGAGGSALEDYEWANVAGDHASVVEAQLARLERLFNIDTTSVSKY